MTRMELAKTFRFESAHLLPNVPADHKCRRLHGHSFRATVRVTGAVDPHTGWVMDYADIARAFEPVRLALDHRHLNEIEGLDISQHGEVMDEAATQGGRPESGH